jgi:hypothetical protein
MHEEVRARLHQSTHDSLVKPGLFHERVIDSSTSDVGPVALRTIDHRAFAEQISYLSPSRLPCSDFVDGLREEEFFADRQRRGRRGERGTGRCGRHRETPGEDGSDDVSRVSRRLKSFMPVL